MIESTIPVMPAAHPLDIKLKKEPGIDGPVEAVRDRIQNILWGMRFNGTWTLTITEQSNESSEAFECFRKERDAAKISVCHNGVTYKGYLAAPRRYNVSDVIAKLKTKNTPKTKSSKLERESRISKILETLNEVQTEVKQPEPVEHDVKAEPVTPKVEQTADTTILSPMDQEKVQEIMALHLPNQPGKMKWFSRKFRIASTLVQEEIRNILIKSGYSTEKKPRSRQSKCVSSDRTESHINWTDDEWERLTDLIEPMRRNNPEPPLIILVNRALAQFPEGRRRNLRGTRQLEPLSRRLKERYQVLVNAKSDKDKLIEQLSAIKEAPTKEEILSSLTDAEIIQNFSQKVLDNLSPIEICANFSNGELLEGIPKAVIIGYAVQQIIESIAETANNFNLGLQNLGTITQGVLKAQSKTAPSVPISRPTLTQRKLPKVTIVGMKGDQSGHLEDKFTGRAIFNFLNKDQAQICVPPSTDILVFWGKFCGHKTQEQIKSRLPSTCRFIIHHGGTVTLAETLEPMINRY